MLLYLVVWCLFLYCSMALRTQSIERVPCGPVLLAMIRCPSPTIRLRVCCRWNTVRYTSVAQEVPKTMQVECGMSITAQGFWNSKTREQVHTQLTQKVRVTACTKNLNPSSEAISDCEALVPLLFKVISHHWLKRIVWLFGEAQWFFPLWFDHEFAVRAALQEFLKNLYRCSATIPYLLLLRSYLLTLWWAESRLSKTFTLRVRGMMIRLAIVTVPSFWWRISWRGQYCLTGPAVACHESGNPPLTNCTRIWYSVSLAAACATSPVEMIGPAWSVSDSMAFMWTIFSMQSALCISCGLGTKRFDSRNFCVTLQLWLTR